MSSLEPADLPGKLNVGCGHDKRAGYLNVDVDPGCHPDLLLADHDLLARLPIGHFDEVLAWDVLEHIPHAYTMTALLDWSALLKGGGTLVLQTSSILGVAEAMLAAPTFEIEFNWTRCLFGNQAHPGDFHHVGFTERTLRTHLMAAGFRFGAFTTVDRWLLQCSAVKEHDWTELLALPAGDAVSAAFARYLERDITPDALAHYVEEASRGRPLRDLLKQIVGAPEALYKLGQRLDSQSGS